VWAYHDSSGPDSPTDGGDRVQTLEQPDLLPISTTLSRATLTAKRIVQRLAMGDMPWTYLGGADGGSHFVA
jgi:hypothetical protein